jgi:hypothetical protein
MRALVPLVLAVAIQAPADFSGRWEFDREKTMQPGPDGRIVVAAMLGDAVVVRQDPKTIAFTIDAGGMLVKAVYNLDGTETRNLSPGPPDQPEIPVTSRASWDGKRLVILSKSTAIEKGVAVTVDTRRVLWIDKDGNLIVERTGTPATLVTPSRSVYRRIKTQIPLGVRIALPPN